MAKTNDSQMMLKNRITNENRKKESLNAGCTQKNIKAAFFVPLLLF